MKNNNIGDEDYGQDNPDIDESTASWLGEAIAVIIAVGVVAVFLAVVVKLIKWIIGF
jgi:hypothetical protein